MEISVFLISVILFIKAKDTVQQSQRPYLPAVGMSGQLQIKTKLGIFLQRQGQMCIRDSL